ncbi:MAG: PDZ domain-containing protein [Proteobacteria bacterium]|nr:PDZ domain-containing protein [Pseudomonadota bacterium]
MDRIALLLVALVLGGCANGYMQFYHPYPGATPEAISKMRASPPPVNPQVEHIASINQSMFEHYENLGYVPIGYSSFNSGQQQSDNNAIEQGRAVGADLIVIANPRYTGTETRIVPITTPTTSTSYSSGTATAYGPYGIVNAYSNGITRTYGTQTTYTPFLVHREDYGAVYFFKRHYVFGALARDLNDAERQSLQTNKGVVITTVVNDTPAFNSDILKGDIITSINGKAIADGRDFVSVLKANTNTGHPMTFTIIRGTQHIEKSIQLETH